MTTLLPGVFALSDEEDPVALKKSNQGIRRAKRPGRGFRKAVASTNTADPQQLRRLINSKCGCTADCFNPWRLSLALWDQWMKLRTLFVSMTKLEKDTHVRSSLLFLSKQ